jgi:hypothetical protein
MGTNALSSGPGPGPKSKTELIHLPKGQVNEDCSGAEQWLLEGGGLSITGNTSSVSLLTNHDIDTVQNYDGTNWTAQQTGKQALERGRIHALEGEAWIASGTLHRRQDEWVEDTSAEWDAIDLWADQQKIWVLDGNAILVSDRP